MAELHDTKPRLPSSFSHRTPDDRKALGLGPTDIAIAHDAIVLDGLVTSLRTIRWRDPPTAVLAMLLVFGDGIGAPPERELRAAGRREAGGAIVPRF